MGCLAAGAGRPVEGDIRVPLPSLVDLLRNAPYDDICRVSDILHFSRTGRVWEVVLDALFRDRRADPSRYSGGK